MLTVDDYVKIISQRQRCSFHYKILNDAHRTLKTDASFAGKVTTDQITRMLNASVFILEDKNSDWSFSYVQGMNVLLAPFIVAFPEVTAVEYYTRFLYHISPTYIQPKLEGVHKAVQLFEMLFNWIDPELHNFLSSKNVTSTVIVFSPLMTFCASMTPLEQVIHLWDFYVYYGFHYNILVVLAHLILARKTIMSHETPSNLLRTSWAPLNAKVLIRTALTIATALPSTVMDSLKEHLVQLE